MFITDDFSANSISIDGNNYLFFSGTSYLGMNHNERFRELIIAGLGKYGNSYGSSRNSNFRLAVYQQAEQQLAHFTGAEAALTLSSGFMAGQLVINVFRNSHHFIFAPDTHPAVCRQPEDFFSGSFTNWTKQVAELVADSNAKDIAIVCNAVDPLYCTDMQFDWVASLPAHKNILLIIDDSHGLGVTGEDGAGIYRTISGQSTVQLVVVSSLAKAMGIPGGVVLSDANTLAYLKKTPTYSAASPATPAYLYAYTRANELFIDARRQLADNIQYFRDRVFATDRFTSLPNYPVFYTPDNHLPGRLADRKILISSFAYPRADSNVISRGYCQ